MAKYMLKASYTVEGTKGVMKDGGSSRRAAVQKTIGLEKGTFYFSTPNHAAPDRSLNSDG